MKKHHYAAPEKRPDSNDQEKNRGKACKADGLREYNIVTNRYLELNELKEKTNEDIQRAEAAIAFWKTHDYDHLTGKYYDERKEKEFTKEREAQA